jgi:crossover junction endodeoxyribonuclease RusA
VSTWVLTLPVDRPPLSLNDRTHWARKADLSKQLRQQTHWLAAAQRLPKRVSFAEVVLTYHPTTQRRRDTDNLFATLKPCIDGLVDYGLVEDDNNRFMLSSCVIGPVETKGRLTLTVTVNNGAAA